MQPSEHLFSNSPPTAEFKKILEAASELFLKFGIRNVSMSDISKHLGISKKTLYAHITNKEDLIHRFAHVQLAAEQAAAEALIAGAKDALDELVQLTLLAQRNMQRMNPCLIHEFFKYHRQGWQLVEQFRQDFIYRNVRRNLERGIAEGIYRADLNAVIISKIYVYSLPIFATPAQLGLEENSPVELHIEFVKYHIHGILSAKGLVLLEHYSFA